MTDPRVPTKKSLYGWLAIAAAAALLYTLRGVLVPLFVAFLIAYALDPIVDRLERARLPRSAGAPLVIVALIGGLGTLFVVFVPALGAEVADAVRRLPAQSEALHQRIDAFLLERFHAKTPATLGELVASYGATLRDSIPDASQIGSAAMDTMKNVFALVSLLVVPVFAVYLLNDFNRIVARAASLVPRRYAPSVTKIVGEVHQALGRYVRGQLICNVILATLYATGLRIVGIHLAIPIGILTGMLAFIPYVGLATGAILALMMALLDFQSAAQVLGVCAVMGGVGLLDSMVITPKIVGGSVGLKPLEVLITMMAGGTIFGFLGVLLAVPLGAVLKILGRHAVEAYLVSGFYRQPPAPVAADGAGEVTFATTLDVPAGVPSLAPEPPTHTESGAPPVTSSEPPALSLPPPTQPAASLGKTRASG